MMMWRRLTECWKKKKRRTTLHNIIDLKEGESSSNSRQNTEVKIASHKYEISVTSNLDFVKSKDDFFEEIKNDQSDNVSANDTWFEDHKLYARDELEPKLIKKLSELSYSEVHFIKRACPDKTNYLEKAKKIPNYLQYGPKFLPRETIATTWLASFPGSNSDILRELLESTTKILTGSDEERSDNFLAEGKIDKVWVVDSHWPYLQGEEFKAKKWIVLARDPVETLYLQYRKTLKDATNIYLDFEEFINDELPKYVKFHKYWMSIDRNIPVFIVKYEDLTNDPTKTITSIICYLLNWSTEDVKGSIIERLIKSSCRSIKIPVWSSKTFDVEPNLIDHIYYQTRELVDRLGLKDRVASNNHYDSMDIPCKQGSVLSFTLL